MLLVALLVLAADITSKIIVVANLYEGQKVPLIPGVLTLTLYRNPGAAFGIGASLTVVYSVIAVGVVVFILRAASRIRSVPWAVTFGLVLGGAAGNLTDRVFRSPGPLRGWVVDWIELPHWPTFNLADSALVCGIALGLLLAVLGVRIEGTRVERTAPGSGAPDGAPGGAPGGGRG